jgi:hypothetical protein
MSTTNQDLLEKEAFTTGCWRLMPVILFTWEAEIGRIKV